MNEFDDGLDAYQRGDYKHALHLLLPLANAGNAKAQCHIASMYQGGLGVPVSGQEAVKWYTKAAEQKDLEGKISGIAYNNLATIFFTGVPEIPADFMLAELYWRKAVELGFKMIPQTR